MGAGDELGVRLGGEVRDGRRGGRVVEERNGLAVRVEEEMGGVVKGGSR